MRKLSMQFTVHHTLLCATAAGSVALLSLCSPAIAAAQTPALVATVTRTAFLHRAAQVQPESNATPASDPQSTPAPPTPPDPNSFKDELFAGTEKFSRNANSATEVNMDPDSLRMVKGPDASRARRTLLSVVRTYSYDKPGMYDMAEVEVYRRKLETGGWHCSIHTRDLKTGESTDICSKRREPDMIENAIITVEPKSLTFIHSIKRANGEGGQLDHGYTPGMLVLPEFPSTASFAALDAHLRSQLRAELAASTAEMAGEQATMRAEMLASTAHLRAEMGQMHAQSGLDADHLREQLDQVRSSLRDLPRLNDNKQLQELRDRLQQDHEFTR